LITDFLAYTLYAVDPTLPSPSKPHQRKTPVRLEHSPGMAGFIRFPAFQRGSFQKLGSS